MTTRRTIHEKLRLLSRNLWWAWNPQVIRIFRDLDPVLFQKLGHNPIAILKEIPPQVLEKQTLDTHFHARVDRALRQLEGYLKNEDTWSAIHAGVLEARPVAYFSAEFGIHESLPIYSGGLGILAGDHLKSASDLGIPLYGVGLFYKQGYFRQRLDENGWQNSEYVDNDPAVLPMKPALTPSGDPVKVLLETREGHLHARVWQVDVGRCALILLDSDVRDNSPEDRSLTARLYGGDSRTRIRQELLLGVGGVRALHKMGISPGVLHLNEGHSAFATLESARIRMERDGLEFSDASVYTAMRTVFTTHTPVDAGHDRFQPDLVESTLGPLRESLSLSQHDLLAMGRVDRHDSNEPFCMTVLALRMSRYANGVSALHGGISRKMWRKLWPELQELQDDQVPIGHITNGVHARSWLAPEMHALYDRHFTPMWPRDLCEPETWRRIDQVEDAELWETHRLLKVRLVRFVRARLAYQQERRGARRELVERASRVLDPEALTIGFARRFATYKRADLLFGDIERLAKLISIPKRPVQFIFAGKAHPQDFGGKELIQEIVRIASQDVFRDRLVFLEDHDMNIGRHLIQGVDAWLNTPRRPVEASGTSGQKCLLNGVLNISVLDGWWPEAYDGHNGFSIGDGGAHADAAIQDARDREYLYDVLENEVVPMYYDRDADGIPFRWVQRMKRAIRTLGWKFNTDRMVMNYAEDAYLRAAGGQLKNPRRW